MAASSTGLSADIPAKQITVCYGADECKLLALPGMEPDSLTQAVEGHFDIAVGTKYYFTMKGRTEVVPLSTALPGGITLALHLHESRRPGPFRRLSTRARTSDLSSSLVSADDKMQMKTSLLSAAQDVEGSGRARSELLPRPGMSQQGSPNSLSLPYTKKATMDGEPESIEDSIVASFASVAEVAPAMDQAAATITEMTTSIDRFSRLSSDLANERTLLAWFRTGMAAIRTTFAFMGVTAALGFWSNMVNFCEAIMMSVVLLAAFTGTSRFMKIQKVLLMRTPPASFGRITTRWFTGFIVVACISTAVGVFTQEFVKKK